MAVNPDPPRQAHPSPRAESRGIFGSALNRIVSATNFVIEAGNRGGWTSAALIGGLTVISSPLGVAVGVAGLAAHHLYPPEVEDPNPAPQPPLQPIVVPGNDRPPLNPPIRGRGPRPPPIVIPEQVVTPPPSPSTASSSHSTPSPSPTLSTPSAPSTPVTPVAPAPPPLSFWSYLNPFNWIKWTCRWLCSCF